mgnify:CR=1 FL=1|tara:strand:+ start:49 stop:576 length:528 start_codon:yes stop_codon:yes gene_type:complete
METCQIENYTISIQDNPPEHLFENHLPKLSDNTPTCQHGITVSKNQSEQNLLINGFGGATGIHKNSYVINETNIFICVSDTVYCLDLETLNHKWSAQADQATCFGIYLVDNSLIIHGELQISSLSLSGKINWQQHGKDIFTTQSDDHNFEIKNNIINVKDWGNNNYKLNLKGEFV